MNLSTPLLSTSMSSPTWKLLSLSLPRVFSQVSLHMHDWLNHWPCDWAQSRDSSSPDQSFNPLITWASPWKLSKGHHESLHCQKLRYGPKGFVINNKRYSYHSGNSKGFWSPVPEQRTKTKHAFLLSLRWRKGKIPTLASQEKPFSFISI